mmetsp:Transcript_14613/g.31974  ORF Transcript_14613/g.31974 Transcript_14613/m.31974 type:complete len:102 (-) Transcript_14613:571-876(-)|eukprot:CAMPEP_0170617050 /NCGR_PEP_ID=MMETSP0224-20130122/26199_1 /TAXON_ID=285029 /ORGANISM="Togula jolla, Strain CCCM 725" /LENGTH=101 /DNA_ID=CAMNT_0010942893 /DNA_START=2654 /DNA_END=2959 /DNA_ORIENTATION=+
MHRFTPLGLQSNSALCRMKSTGLRKYPCLEGQASASKPTGIVKEVTTKDYQSVARKPYPSILSASRPFGMQPQVAMLAFQGKDHHKPATLQEVQVLGDQDL